MSLADKMDRTVEYTDKLEAEIASLKAERDRWMEQAITQSKLCQELRAALENDVMDVIAEWANKYGISFNSTNDLSAGLEAIIKRALEENQG